MSTEGHPQILKIIHPQNNVRFTPKLGRKGIKKKKKKKRFISVIKVEDLHSHARAKNNGTDFKRICGIRNSSRGHKVEGEFVLNRKKKRK